MVGSTMRQLIMAVVVAVSILPSFACDTAHNTRSVRLQRPFAEAHDDVLTLRRDMFNQPFLLSPTLILSSPTPQVMPMRPKLVAFELHAGTVALVEQQPAAVYDTLPNDRLLDTFSVRAMDNDTVSFAWGQGMHIVPLGSPTAASDIPGSLQEGLTGGDAIAPVVATYVKSTRLHGDALELVQVSRLRLPQEDRSAELHVRFEPYKPNDGFRVQPSPMIDGIGYFEVSSLMPNSGAVAAQATRWDVGQGKGPIDYALAADTPIEVREVIAEGILYWNRVAGKELVSVSIAPVDAVVAKPHQVLVHWVPWTTAGFASSALQPDPRTGEILSGDIYLTSFWINIAEEFVDGRALSALQKKPDPARPRFAPAGFSDASVCNWGGIDAIARWHSEAADLPDPLLPRALDHLRAVVAHETGHTLGLRHNFAGSLGSELRSPNAQKRAWQRYLDGQGGARTSDSVMDYTTMMDTMLQGAALKTEVFPYDVLAMSWGYGDAPAQRAALKQAAKGRFCTDMEARVGTSLGCQLNDSGPQPLQGYKADLDDQARLATTVLRTWLRMGWNIPEMSYEQVAGWLDPGHLITAQVRPAMDAFRQLQQGATVLDVDRALGGRNWLNTRTYKDATLRSQVSALADVGGLPGLLQAGLRLDATGGVQPGFVAEILAERLDAWLSASLITASDADALRSALPQVGGQLEDIYVMALFAALTGGLTDAEGMEANKSYAEGLADPAWAPALDAMAASIILSEDGVTEGEVNARKVAVGTPRYSLRTRLAAARVYSADVFQVPNWMRLEGERVAAVIGMRSAGVLGKGGRNVRNASDVCAAAQDEPRSDDAASGEAGERGLGQPAAGAALSPKLPRTASADAPERGALFISPALRKWMDESDKVLRALDRSAHP